MPSPERPNELPSPDAVIALAENICRNYEGEPANYGPPRIGQGGPTHLIAHALLNSAQRIKRLEAALKPFAELMSADQADRHVRIYGHTKEFFVDIEHIEAAQNALKERQT